MGRIGQLPFDGDPERAVAEGQQLSVGRPGAFGQDHDGHALVQTVVDLLDSHLRDCAFSPRRMAMSPAIRIIQPMTGIRNMASLESHFISHGRWLRRKISAKDSWLATATYGRRGSVILTPSVLKCQTGMSLTDGDGGAAEPAPGGVAAGVERRGEKENDGERWAARAGPGVRSRTRGGRRGRSASVLLSVPVLPVPEVPDLLLHVVDLRVELLDGLGEGLLDGTSSRLQGGREQPGLHGELVAAGARSAAESRGGRSRSPGPRSRRGAARGAAGHGSPRRGRSGRARARSPNGPRPPSPGPPAGRGRRGGPRP